MSQRPVAGNDIAARSGTSRWLLLFILAGLPGTARAAEPLTLARALSLARDANPDLLAARREVEIARGRLVKAHQWNQFNPEVEGGAADRSFGAGGSDVQPAAALALEIEVAGQRAARIEEARQHLARVEAEVENASRLLTALITEAVYRTLYLARRRQLLHDVDALNRRLRDAATERFTSGAVPKLEANLAVLRHTQSQKERVDAERDERNARRELERLLGREPLGTIEVAGDLAVQPLTVNPEALVAAALEHRPDLQGRTAEIRRIEAENTLVKRLTVPNPTVRVRYEEEPQSSGGSDRIVGGAISIPLPLFDRRAAELTALAGRRAQATDARRASVLAVETDVRNAYDSYEAARAIVSAFETDALARIGESFRFVETAYREGKIDLVQLIVVENDLVSAQLSYLNSLWEYWLARTALELAVGQALPPRTETAR